MNSVSEQAVPGTRPKRRAATEEKIRASVLKIAREHGFPAVTIDAVVADSGVAKTTIYRRYADRSEMLAAVLSHVAIDIPINNARTREEFADYVLTVEKHITQEIGLRVFASAITSSDPSVEEWRMRLRDEVLVEMTKDIRMGQEEGRLSKDFDAELFVSMVLGSIMLRSAFNVGTAQEHADDMAEFVWPRVEGQPES